jgi:hypothetical protein
MAIFNKTIERELTDTQRRLENLEARREVLASEHSRSVEERRKLLLDGSEDVKALNRADARVTAAESALAGVDDALITVRGQVADLKAKLDATRGAADREARAKQCEELFPPMQEAFAKAEAALREFIDACRRATDIPEALNIANWCEQQVLATVPSELAYVGEIIKQRANGLRQPPPPLASAPKAPPKPELAPQPWRVLEPTGPGHHQWFSGGPGKTV